MTNILKLENLFIKSVSNMSITINFFAGVTRAVIIVTYNVRALGFEEFREIGQSNIVPGDMYTNISSKNMRGSKCYDNIWLGKQTRQQTFTGRFGELLKTAI